MLQNSMAETNQEQQTQEENMDQAWDASMFQADPDDANMPLRMLTTQASQDLQMSLDDVVSSQDILHPNTWPPWTSPSGQAISEGKTTKIQSCQKKKIWEIVRNFP
jgi:hypothetical protein